MATMGGAGVIGSVLAARFFSEPGGRHLLATGFALSAAAAAWTLGATTAKDYAAGALLVGLGTGLTTVTLAALLRRSVGDGRLGLVIGAGTGLAYGFCNLPGIFDADATMQTRLALLAVAVGWAGGRGLSPGFPAEAPVAGEYTRRETASWVVVLGALVCLDSAVFYCIQHTPELSEIVWTGKGRLVMIAAMHLGAAVLTGWMLDRGRLFRMAGLGALALLVAAWLITRGHEPLGWAGLLYVAGVSVYSTVLVYYPARSGRPGLAALIYAVAGWGGSAAGIGLVAEGRGVSAGLLLVAGSLVLLGLAVGNTARRRATQPCVSPPIASSS
jgi:cytochrome c oxidase cbb3-type subunit 2